MNELSEKEQKLSVAHIEDVWRQARCLCTEKQVLLAIDRVAQQIERDLKDKNPVVICIMNGGLMFTGQLLQRLPFVLQCDYVHVTRYGLNTQGGGTELDREAQFAFEWP